MLSNTILKKIKNKKWIVSTFSSILIILLSFVYLLATSPYSKDTIIKPPFTTQYVQGQITLTTHYTPHFYTGFLANVIGYYKGGVAMVWDRITSPSIPAENENAIIAGIYTLRFDPSKPYLISGDQFDGLYLRNLSIFYQGLLDKHTTISTTDWQNRQRIAVQSLAYGLVATQQLHRPVTTLMPISPHSVLAINIYDYPSDTMFSLFDLIERLEQDPATHHVALTLQHTYGNGIEEAYKNYLTTVRDPKTGLIRSDIYLSSARDAAQRQSSFYDNVILWKTEQLATQLGFDHVSEKDLATLKNKIIKQYWDATQGHFIDDIAPGDEHSYSSDWLIVLPTGFLQSTQQKDLSKLERISTYIDKEHLVDPLPLRYTTTDRMNENIFVKLFASDYGSTAIWCYWGDLYMTLETDLYEQTHQSLYADHVMTSVKKWEAVIVRDRGYPETLDAKGNVFETPVYRSIIRNGWVVDFEEVKYNWNHLKGK